MKRFVFTILMVASVLMAAALPRASLLTAMPGEEVFQLEGHTALRVADSATGMDVVVNWGVFDFDAPNFVWRFVTGKTDYLCIAYPTQFFLEGYFEEGRAVIEQPLELDSASVVRLVDMLKVNLRPENATYRYNYVLDNCATRPLDLIEAALGRSVVGDSLTSLTFRSEMQRFHCNYPWYQFGIDLALGRGIDRPVTLRETAFAPMNLLALMNDSGIVGETSQYGVQTLVLQPTPPLLTPMAVSLLVLLLAMVSVVSTKWGRVFDTVYFTVAFLAGILLAFLVFVSTHEATSPNLLLMWLNPFCLAGVILPWIKSAKKAGICYFFVNFALLILLAVAAPLSGRVMNAAFWPLIAADALRSLANIYECCKSIKNHH